MHDDSLDEALERYFASSHVQRTVVGAGGKKNEETKRLLRLIIDSRSVGHAVRRLDAMRCLEKNACGDDVLWPVQNTLSLPLVREVWGTTNMPESKFASVTRFECTNPDLELAINESQAPLWHAAAMSGMAPPLVSAVTAAKSMMEARCTKEQWLTLVPSFPVASIVYAKPLPSDEKKTPDTAHKTAGTGARAVVNEGKITYNDQTEYENNRFFTKQKKISDERISELEKLLKQNNDTKKIEYQNLILKEHELLAKAARELAPGLPYEYERDRRKRMPDTDNGGTRIPYYGIDEDMQTRRMSISLMLEAGGCTPEIIISTVESFRGEGTDEEDLKVKLWRRVRKGIGADPVNAFEQPGGTKVNYDRVKRWAHEIAKNMHSDAAEYARRSKIDPTVYWMFHSTRRDYDVMDDDDTTGMDISGLGRSRRMRGHVDPLDLSLAEGLRMALSDLARNALLNSADAYSRILLARLHEALKSRVRLLEGQPRNYFQDLISVEMRLFELNMPKTFETGMQRAARVRDLQAARVMILNAWSKERLPAEPRERTTVRIVSHLNDVMQDDRLSLRRRSNFRQNMIEFLRMFENDEGASKIRRALETIDYIDHEPFWDEIKEGSS